MPRGRTRAPALSSLGLGWATHSRKGRQSFPHLDLLLLLPFEARREGEGEGWQTWFSEGGAMQARSEGVALEEGWEWKLVGGLG